MNISVDVDIDLDQFDTEDLVQELISRIRYNCRRKGEMTEKQKERIRNEIKQISSVLEEVPMFRKKSLDDVMKIELLNSVWDKYTSFQLEKILA